MNKRFLFLVVACTTAFLVLAQQNKKTDIQKMQDEFEKYKNEERESFKNYRDEENRKFADYMRKEWEAFRAFQGIPIPKSPDPVTPPVKKDPEVEPENHPVPQGKLVPVPEPKKQPLPAEPIPVTPEKENSSVLNFTFFDIPCSVAWNDNLKFNISSLDGNSLAGVWSTLSGKAYNDFLSG